MTKKRLDELIATTAAKASKRGQKKHTASKAAPEPKALVPLKSPDEPAVIAPVTTGTKGMNQYRRRNAERMAADERRRQFARSLFMSGFKSDQAFKEAGYTASTRHDMLAAVSKLMNEPVVIDELAQLTLRARAELEAKAVDVTREWAAIANSNVFDYVQQNSDGYISVRDLSGLTRDQQRALQSIKATKTTIEIPRKDAEPIIKTTELVEVRVWDKHAALTSLARLQGLFRDENDEALTNLATAIQQRIAAAERRMGRTYDHEPAGT